jgi:hypothetical protein
MMRAATACACFVLLASFALPAQERDEKAVRAAFVFSLSQYVEWPSKRDQLTIAYVGDGPMGKTLQKILEGKLSANRRVHIVLSPSAEALEKCEVVYIGYASSARSRLELDQLRPRSVLTIGDAAWFAGNGGMIGLVTSGDQIKLQVNLKVLEAAQLKISSRVLKLATIVGTPGETGN